MNDKSLRALEYDKVLNKLVEYCKNDDSKEQALNLKPLNNKEDITFLLENLDEMVNLVLRNGNLPLIRISNISPLVSRSKISSILSMSELLDILQVLNLVNNIIDYYHSDQQEIQNTYLKDLFLSLDSCIDLRREISRKIISATEIADDASPNLKKIRREIEQKNRLIAKRIDSIINNKNNDKYLQEKLVSMRNGRYVIPVQAKYRDKFPGAVLDRSSTGQTLFIEPLSVLELNNEIKELEILEKKEIDKILKDLTEQVKDYAEELTLDYNNIIALDFLLAKALYALDTNSSKVIFNDNEIELKQARHPLISKDKVIPSTINISKDNKILVITGPNTGGKTVTLKTMGLLSAMAQSGLFIPVKNNSKLKVFDSIYADIGDEQSIEQNLSTFSAHLNNIVEILDNVDGESLVLLDELGAGTDPTEGAALAISILDYLKNNADLTVATTHYPEIKEYALIEDNTLNASMEFDIKTLKPTYKLIIGLPGKSNAFEIANSLGLNREIIENARGQISQSHKQLDDTLGAAQQELQIAREKREKAETMYKKAKNLFEETKKKKESVEEKTAKIISKANEEAQKIVNQTKKETDYIYKEITKIQRDNVSNIDNKRLENLRKDLKKTEEKVYKDTNLGPKETKQNFKFEDFKIDDQVYIKSLGQEAIVNNLNPKKKEIEVMVGAIRMKFKPKDLAIVNKKKEKSKIKLSVSKPKVRTRLDLRGKTVDETFELVDSFINDAVILGVNKLEIIHGFGTGQVRKAVHDYLRKSKYIKSYRLGGPGEGGAGATIIEL